MLNHSAASDCNPRDCGPPGSSVHVTSQARILEWVAQGIFPTQGSSPQLLSLLLWQAGSLPLSHLRSPIHQVTQAKTKPCQSPGITLDITCLLPASSPIPSPIYSFPNFHQSIILVTHLYFYCQTLRTKSCPPSAESLTLTDLFVFM